MVKRRLAQYICFALLTGLLYFFENGSATRALLCWTFLLPLLPAVRRGLFAPDAVRGKASASIGLTVDRPDEDSLTGVRDYTPGDPVSRIHWKLSVKRGALLVRERDSAVAPERTEAGSPAEGSASAAGRRRAAGLCLLIALLLLALLLLLPGLRHSAGALMDRVYDLSEARNAYRYDRPALPEGVSPLPAGALMAAVLAMVIAVTVIRGSRGMALMIWAGLVAFQVYFGILLPWPILWASALFVLLIMAARPLTLKAALPSLAAVAVALAFVLLIFPGTDAMTEEASERVRDALAPVSDRAPGIIAESPEGETETRHVHTRSLVTGVKSAAERSSYRLLTHLTERISLPEWLDHARVALLLMLSVLVVELPFAPFMWLAARRKRALDKRRAFRTGDRNARYCAVFRHLAAMWEATGVGMGNLPYRDWEEALCRRVSDEYALRFAACARLFEQAAYSARELTEEQLASAIGLFGETERLVLERADRRTALRLKYGECLCV